LDLPILNNHILSAIIFLPLAGAFILLFLRNETTIRYFTLIVMVFDFALAIPLICTFDRTVRGMQFVERYEWIPSLGARYYLGIDGISVLFVFLTTLIGWICVLASWRAIEKKVKEFMIALLFIQSAMLGVFSALDVLLFFISWEFVFIPMYAMIAIWGGENRVYATVKFFVYTVVGSIFMLIGVVALYKAGGTFDIPQLMVKGFPFSFQVFAFVFFFIAFAIKVPMFPFHTWLPFAHVEAPTAGSIILAAILLKMGTYGFLRFPLSMFPDASRFLATPVVILSIIAIIYGAFLALSQSDMKRLVAYSSVSHMGFVTMGLFLMNKNGIEGGILQMFNHGITTGALFLCVGIIYERTHTRDLRRYGWAAKAVPFYAFFLLIFTLASMGFPGTNGFIGELLILIGAYQSYKIYLVFLITGIMLGAAYMLWMYKRISFGAGRHDEYQNEHYNEAGHGGHGEEEHAISDINFREVVAISALLIFVFWIGFQPMYFLNMMDGPVSQIISRLGGH